MIDFDRAHYGFRMWDILYFLTNYQLDFVPNHDELVEMLNCEFYKRTFQFFILFVAYIEHQTYESDLTVETLLEEKDHILPYILMERLSSVIVSLFY